MTSATLNLDSGLSAAVEAASRSKNRALEERVKVLIEEGTNRILGAQLLGRHAEEVIV
ncbi:MAG: hypothetical protein HYY65_05125 [Candidatus Tectomicrobia bacterium]|uniref:Uncharacterized protein n=1 Tax=Tectimicrobiota bacterium TaxID=2528274 RepID=A0A932M065_UNCTE|nr:hypothetical protein [Candidatus Tectomicrobia bacterium]